MLTRSGPCRTPRAMRAISAPLTCSWRSSTAAYSSRRKAWRNVANSRHDDAAKGRCRQRRNATGTIRRMPGWSSSSGTNPVSATQSIASSGRCARTSATRVSAWTMSPSDEGRTTRMALMVHLGAARQNSGETPRMRACEPGRDLPWHAAREASASTARIPAKPRRNARMSSLCRDDTVERDAGAAAATRDEWREAPCAADRPMTMIRTRPSW